MQAWEYKIVPRQEVDEVHINELGAQGWELVAVYVGSERAPDDVPMSATGLIARQQSGASPVYIFTAPTWVFKRPKHE